MTSGTKPRLGEVVAFARAGDDRADDLLGAVVPARLREEPSGATLDNVVPFVPPRSNDNAKQLAPAPVLVPADRPTVTHRVAHTMVRGTVFLAISMLVHAALFAPFLWRDPQEHAGTELEGIIVEIVPPGSNTPAGQATRPTENEGVEQPGQVTDTPSEQPVQQVETPTTDQPQEVPVAEQETAPEQPVVAEQPTPAEAQEPEPPREVVPQPEPRETVAMVEMPQAEMPTVAPRPNPPPDPEKVTLAPPPTPQVAKPEPDKPVEKPKQLEQAKKREQKPKAAERKRLAARTDERTQERTTGPRVIEGSSGTGRGGPAPNPNYRGQVSAHLQRHKQYPSDARARGDQGVATVSFSIDGGGRVTSVRLGRSSGHPSLDQEVQAMVRRASPFPAPPDGRAQSFAVPVGFSVR